MSRRLFGVALIAGLSVMVADFADAFTSRHGTRVNPVNANVFEVIPRSGGSGAMFWCGAGDYAQRELGASWQARVYIARGRAQSETTGRRSAVQFTLDPAAVGVTPIQPSLSINSLKVGDNMTVRMAFEFCRRSVAL